MRLPFCGCGQPLWAPESAARGFCEYCRLHHAVHWPAFGHHPRGLPYPPPDENPVTYERRPPVVPGLHVNVAVIHRHTCPIIAGKHAAWLWANTASLGEILYAAAYFGYETCKQCHPLASYEDPSITVV